MRTTSFPRLVFKGLTAVMVAAGWGVLGYGLQFSRAEYEVWYDLGAGGRFGLNFGYYLPYYALSLPLGIVAIVGLFPRPDRMFPLAGAMGLTGLFAQYILANDLLLVAQPDLATYASVGLGLTAAAVVPLLTAHSLKERPATT